MGGRLPGGAARQRSHLSAAPSGRVRNVVLAVLTFDGVLSAIAAAFLFPLHLGAVPMPVSGLLSGLINAALVWVALQWTPSPRLAALPLWAWLGAIIVLTLGGPGGDIVLSGSGIYQVAPLLLILLGAGPPAYVLWRLTAKADV